MRYLFHFFFYYFTTYESVPRQNIVFFCIFVFIQPHTHINTIGVLVLQLPNLTLYVYMYTHTHKLDSYTQESIVRSSRGNLLQILAQFLTHYSQHQCLLPSHPNCAEMLFLYIFTSNFTIKYSFCLHSFSLHCGSLSGFLN